VDKEVYIYQNISYLRRQKKISQEALGSVVGKSKETINGYEKGRSDPPFKILLSIASFFNITLDDLVYNDLSQHTIQLQESKHPYTKAPAPQLEDLEMRLDKLVEVVGSLRDEVELLKE
jgi:DNA-binding XRE family transcriptional regulator